MKRKWKDFRGLRFGSLTCVRHIGTECCNGKMFATWLLRCDCGNEIVLSTNRFCGRKYISCGCKDKRRKHNSSHDKVVVDAVKKNYASFVSSKPKSEQDKIVKLVLLMRMTYRANGGKPLLSAQFQKLCEQVEKFKVGVINARKV